MKKFLPILFIINLYTVSICAQVNTSDSLSLVQFYSRTGGMAWSQQYNWLTGPVASWQGVTLTGDRVTELRLPGNGLTGNNFGGALNQLSMLEVIDLSDNQLSGNIPDTFYFSLNLAEVNFSHNNFTGKFPKSLSTRNSLIKADVSYNQLSGKIPEGLCSLSGMQELKLNNNSFTFEGMECIATVTGSSYNNQQKINADKKNNILTVSVGGTAVNNTYTWYRDSDIYATISGDSSFAITETGTYYVSVTNIVATQLILESNPIIIAPIQNTDSLALLDIYSALDGNNWTDNTNWLSGTPAATWSGITVENGEVTMLDLSDRNLSGEIMRNNKNANPSKRIMGLSDALQNLTALNWLSLANNNLSGNIPSGIANLSNLTYLSLKSNSFNGAIPQGICDLNNLTTIDISNNAFNFDGMECIGQKQGAIYDNQRNLTVTNKNPNLAVTAGGTLAKNTYTWYKDNILLESRTGDSTLTITTSGTYYVVVTNTDASGLSLISSPLSVSEVLPLEWIGFTAQSCSGNICLTWITQNEYNTSHFEVEKSSDGVNFKKLHAVISKNSSSKNEYSYTDMNPEEKYVYYRIKQTDKDGKYTYSKTVLINNAAPHSLQFYPNPANDYFIIQGVRKSFKIIIYNSAGLVVKQETGVKEGIPVYINNLNPGVYIAKIIDSSNNEIILKLIKQ
ncbi:hypothetical protein DC498_14105 [Terrimonas sp.]|uniref:T9SS type A sorting domain-containing protein n=1 Tax=Terrimonas sp. TaxID=1914338 RepID=UPI000D51AFC5|nr:T9SS type A sorting domain-containing protein [Terrimonas sp.]PVD51553.1 hypothetical protein DC498_14105 [Terrimonas sp.]